MANLPKIGVDIGSASIKLVELVPSGRMGWRLTAAITVPSPVARFVDSPTGQTAMAQSLAKAYKEAGMRAKRVVVALPEEQISTHVVEMPALSEAEVEQALKWQVEQYIPIPAEQAIWSYQVIRKTEGEQGGMEILLAAVAKTTVEGYQKVIEQAGLEVLAMETELMATARAVVPPGAPLALIVDIGAKSTDLGIVDRGMLVFSRTIPTAGEAFTRAIESALGVDSAQAEQFKNSYGFSKQLMEGKLGEIMRPVLSIIASEIRKTGDFYLSKHGGDAVKEVVLAGGVAALPDVVGILSGALGLEVVVGDPFSRVELDKKQRQVLGAGAPLYAVSVGLAMRET
ncbi:hypothetical protein A2899_01365 [Candidatus Amesbacteria bacterium RIFCSPLOWO2_01_FULL_49_25]|uniref:SHS2 domain-containing protein n=1 Tax=Candidatus Amesbacteria bacterium RIFCSPHIGHO2_01_FULL_48_32b TaxID=1797253 RepID=A0A1F4YG06_9BACT|nr:MAG: hypothetical protein A2876_01605 [Candidatus Amesbacteria bacterium RIFCSPHIGHO2_01_FULL_48_32b]OGD07347.1 MAG: hypothetical protein A2899_01365 [Candidatus Amesbacteria bacterium RIFCSPLOWO2_01_FULL_49_25]